MHVIAAKAVCFKEALSDDFKVYQQGKMCIRDSDSSNRGFNRDFRILYSRYGERTVEGCLP